MFLRRPVERDREEHTRLRKENRHKKFVLARRHGARFGVVMQICLARRIRHRLRRSLQLLLKLSSPSQFRNRKLPLPLDQFRGKWWCPERGNQSG